MSLSTKNDSGSFGSHEITKTTNSPFVYFRTVGQLGFFYDREGLHLPNVFPDERVT